MSMILRFRALSDEHDDFLRVYDVPYDINLALFHRFICFDLCFDPNEMASFFISNEHWERLAEFTLYDMDDGRDDAPEPMETACLGQLIHNNKDRLIYRFDTFGDRSLYLELSGCYEADPEKKYPSIIESLGTAPEQFIPETFSDSDASIFSDVMEDFDDFVGDDDYDDF